MPLRSRCARNTVRDVIALTKPSITAFALFTTVGGVILSSGDLELWRTALLLLGVGLIVGAANTLNMYLERELDGRMARTRYRPLPDKRISPRLALVVGWAQAAAAIPTLAVAANLLTASLGVLAFVLYVYFYTPLKQKTTVATLVGAVPGAMPTLMGWSGAAGQIDGRALALFGLLFLWQLPHFYAISIYRAGEYERAGLKVLPNSRGLDFTKRAIAVLVVAQVAASLALAPMGVAGAGYLIVAALLGIAYAAHGLVGLRATSGPRWARKLFVSSVIYLPILFAALLVDGR